jgi:hypothetical protein
MTQSQELSTIAKSIIDSNLYLVLGTADALKEALEDYKRGAKCQNCGNPIWMIGSALAGNMCFTCITGEAISEDDCDAAR